MRTNAPLMNAPLQFLVNLLTTIMKQSTTDCLCTALIEIVIATVKARVDSYHVISRIESRESIDVFHQMSITLQPTDFFMGNSTPQ
jgi:hypothetical protein